MDDSEVDDNEAEVGESGGGIIWSRARKEGWVKSGLRCPQIRSRSKYGGTSQAPLSRLMVVAGSRAGVMLFFFPCYTQRIESKKILLRIKE
jgi:hypothetical protein